MRPSLRSDSLISVSFDWKSSLAGMHVGWIWVKHGFAISAPRLCARHAAVTLDALALVERKKTLPYPPVASTTAWAENGVIAPVTRCRATTPQARPSFTTRSSISVRVWSSTLPRCTWRASAW